MADTSLIPTRDTLPLAEQIAEIAKCLRSFRYFCDNYCKVLNRLTGEWVPFKLWEMQEPVAEALQRETKIVVLKPRQVGLSQLCLARIVHRSIFFPNSLSLVYSLRDDESIELLRWITRREAPGGMYEQLPAWMRGKVTGNAHVAAFPNGSMIRALPTTAGDSYTANVVLVDEADIVPNLNSILRRVKPTIDNGGQLILISRADKSPSDGKDGKGANSTFKRIYMAAVEGANSYKPFFLPWHARPDRTQEWYNEQKRDVLARTGSLDDLYESYPATDSEALSPRVQNARIPPEWAQKNYQHHPELLDELPSEVPGLRAWECPIPGRRYVIAADVAEGKETSDDSAAIVLDQDGFQCAELAGRIEIAVYSDYLYHLSKWYNNAGILVERNNHGHAVITRLRDRKANILNGRDGSYGYLSDVRGKAEMYSTVAERLRDEQCKIRSKQTLLQLMSIERATLRAPSGMLDDLADAYAIATVALNLVNVSTGSFESF